MALEVAQVLQQAPLPLVGPALEQARQHAPVVGGAGEGAAVQVQLGPQQGGQLGRQLQAAGVETLSEGATGAGRADLDADYEAPVPEVARMIPGRTYVVWGVYSTEENARRAVAEARARLSDTNFRIYFFGKKWMVSVFESDSAAECRDFMRNAGAGLKEVWPYTKKR